MDQPLRDQIRYLELRLRECRHRPKLHGEQIVAYEAQLAMARAAGSGFGYLQAMTRSGTTLAVVRAEWLDRYSRFAAMYEELGNQELARAARLDVEAAQSASSGPAFPLQVMSARVQASTMVRAFESVEHSLTNLVLGLLDWWVTPAGPAKTERAAMVAATWASVREHDRMCTWQRICEYAPYRRRLPFDDPRLQRLGEWLREIVGSAVDTADTAADTAAEPDATPGTPPDTSPVPTAAPHPTPGTPESTPESTPEHPTPDIPAVPTAAQAAAGYRAIHGTLAADDPSNADVIALYEQVFELERRADSGPAFLRLMAEANLYTALARARHLAQARDGLERSQSHAQPHGVHHYQALERALLECHSPTEVDYEVERTARLFAIHTAWMRITLGFATKLVAALCAYLVTPDDHRRALVQASHEVVREFLGTDGRRLFEAPLIDGLLRQVWFVRARSLRADAPGSVGARAGELGISVVAGIREVALERIIERCAEVGATVDNAEDAERQMNEIRSQPAFATPEALRDHLLSAAERALGHALGQSEPGPPRLVLWGRARSMATAHEPADEIP